MSVNAKRRLIHYFEISPQSISWAASALSLSSQQILELGSLWRTRPPTSPYPDSRGRPTRHGDSLSGSPLSHRTWRCPASNDLREQALRKFSRKGKRGKSAGKLYCSTFQICHYALVWCQSSRWAEWHRQCSQAACTRLSPLARPTRHRKWDPTGHHERFQLSLNHDCIHFNRQVAQRNVSTNRRGFIVNLRIDWLHQPVSRSPLSLSNHRSWVSSPCELSWPFDLVVFSFRFAWLPQSKGC